MKLKLTGKQKAALVLLNLDKNSATKILKTFSQENILEIGFAMASLEKSPPNKDTVEETLREFIFKMEENPYVVKSSGYLYNLLTEAFGPKKADNFMKILKDKKMPTRHLTSLNELDSNDMTTILRDEHPQTIALVMSNLSPEKSTKVLQNFDEERQMEIIERLVTIEETGADVINQLTQTILEKATKLVQNRSIYRDLGDKVENVADILNSLGEFGQNVVLKKLFEKVPKIATQIEESMFTFNDFKSLPTRDIQKILAQMDTKTIAMALKGVDDGLRDHILGSVSKRIREIIIDEKDMMGMVPLDDVQEAQREIIRVAKSLSDEGKIEIRKTKGPKVQMVE